MTPEEYKNFLSKNLRRQPKSMTAAMPVFTKCARTIILRSWPNWKKSLSAMSWTVAVEPAR